MAIFRLGAVGFMTFRISRAVYVDKNHLTSCVMCHKLTGSCEPKDPYTGGRIMSSTSATQQTDRQSREQTR